MDAHMDLMEASGQVDPQAVARYATVAQSSMRYDLGGKVEDLDDLELYTSALAGANEQLRMELTEHLLEQLGLSSKITLSKRLVHMIPRQLHHQLLTDIREEMGF